MTSEMASDKGHAARIAVVEVRVNRTPDRRVGGFRGMSRKVAQRERLRRPLMSLFPMLLAVLGTAYYLTSEPYVSTDDAFIHATKESVNARVAGQVVEIPVRDNQRVARGQLLFQIDPEPNRIAIDQAKAHLDSTRLQVDQLKATYRQQAAQLRSAVDTVRFDELEYARWKALVTEGWMPREAFDQAETTLSVDRQHIASDAQQIANTVAALDGNPNIKVSRHPSVRAAQAQFNQARLNLSYATVVAPNDGIATGVDDLRVGDFVNPGAAVCSLLSSRGIWIEANFRKSSLTNMRPGQAASVRIDAYPDRIFKAHVTRTSPVTGADFLVLPPENATGNWVKVVQRLPVRLEFNHGDPNQPLFSGLSVTVSVDTDCGFDRRHPLRPVCRWDAGK